MELEVDILGMKKQISPLLGRILKKIAPRIGAAVMLEPKWNIVGQINFKNGKKSYFRYSSLDLNPLGASEISKDKDFAYFFMGKMGYPNRRPIMVNGTRHVRISLFTSS